MPLYETVVRNPKTGKETTQQVFARDAQHAKQLFEQLYGGPRYVPYLPRLKSS